MEPLACGLCHDIIPYDLKFSRYCLSCLKNEYLNQKCLRRSIYAYEIVHKSICHVDRSRFLRGIAVACLDSKSCMVSIYEPAREMQIGFIMSMDILSMLRLGVSVSIIGCFILRRINFLT